MTAPLPCAFSMPASARSSAFALSLSSSTVSSPLLRDPRPACVDRSLGGMGRPYAGGVTSPAGERQDCNFEHPFVQGPSREAGLQGSGALGRRGEVRAMAMADDGGGA